MTKPLRVAVAGLGTVGSGVVKLLYNNKNLIISKSKNPIVLVGVSDLDKSKAETLPIDGADWFDNALDMAKSPNVDVIVELIGGAEGFAKTLCETAIANGKYVVTANKALLAIHGVELAKQAEEKGVSIAFEASVAGGIPVIKALKEGLGANNISYIYGIMNGTCNYILSTMRETGKPFSEVLSEAQKLGYAEADPSFDVDGIDTAHKTAILASLAFGMPVDFSSVYIEGIRHIAPEDINYADEFGYRIKLLGIARKTDEGIEQRVHPCMIKKQEAIAHVEGVFNAIVVHGDYVGRSVYEGRGAGETPTASAVVSDIIDIAKGNHMPTFGVLAKDLKKQKIADIKDLETSYYVRLKVLDKLGVFADIAVILKEEGISMENLVQRGHAPNEAVSVVMTLHTAKEKAVQKAVSRISALDTIIEEPCVIRIIEF